MQKLEMYALRDTKTETYNRPIFVQNEKVFLRSLMTELANADSMLAQHPHDYQVFYLGTFDDQTAHIDFCPPEYQYNVADIKAVKDRANQENQESD